MPAVKLRDCYRAVCAALAIGGAIFGSMDVAAADPLGLYVGGAIGQSNIRNDDTFFNRHDLGWKAVAGLRPIAPLGAEVEYIDFGHPDETRGPRRADASAKGAALFGVGYLPLPLPLVDIYGKLGLARLDRKANGGFCGVDGCGELFRLNRQETRFAWGTGAQMRVSQLALRVEYERISASGGDPDLVSIGANWQF